MPYFGNEPVHGSQPLPGAAQAPLSEISGIDAIAEEFAVDPTLPVVDTIYAEGQQLWVKIPKFRIVGIKQRALGNDNSANRPFLTLAGPLDTQANPLGAAYFDLYAELSNRPQAMSSTVIKQSYLRYPFVNGTVGDATLYNTNLTGLVYEGDLLAPDQFGRPVKFVPKRTITVVGVADADGKVAIADASVRYLPVKNVKAFSVAGVAQTATAAWVTDKYVVDTDAAENTVVVISLEVGHEPTKIYGQVGRVKTGRDLESLAGWLQRDMSRQFPLSPMVNFMLTNQRTALEILLDPSAHSTDPADGQSFDGISVSDVESNGQWVRVLLPDRYIDTTRGVIVQYSQNGTDYVTLANAELNLMYSGQDIGPSFAIEPVSGTLVLWLAAADAATTASKVKLTYAYDMVYPHPNFGANANLQGNNGTGIKYLTDGTLTAGVANIKPAAALHPDGAGAYANATMAKKSGLMHILVF